MYINVNHASSTNIQQNDGDWSVNDRVAIAVAEPNQPLEYEQDF